ncbi:unnamed protein product [Cuscuta campestris]|uniref:Uncharacterized protein n=1 Tax=Cuscuta campestris TaxID=132261 RepID=A0A484LX95_9ASTE|nr:unnamed protein product [Cuscuta campestris]
MKVQGVLTIKRKKVQGTLKVLGTVLEQLSKELPHEEAERLIPRELKNMIESDAAMIEDLTYNIIPFDVTTTTNLIVSFPEVRAATSALKYFNGLPNLPRTFSIPTRSADIFDFLHFTFGFQKDNVSNQREHIVHLLANEQSRFQIPEEPEPETRNNDNGRAPHSAWRNYDDFNEYFS